MSPGVRIRARVMNDQGRAYIYAGISIFFWSTVASAFKIGLQYLTPLRFLFIAIMVSCLVFAAITVLQGKIPLLLKTTSRQLLYSALMGLMNPLTYYLVLFRAYSLLPAQVAQPLNMIWPVVMVFLSVPLLKQKVTLKSIVALLICIPGVYLVSSQGNPLALRIGNPAGVFLALGSSLIWSFYWILNLRDQREETTKLTLSFLFAGLFVVPVLLVFDHSGPWPLTGVLMAAYSGVFEMGLTFFLWMSAMKLTSATARISILVYLAPFLSLYIIHIFVGEKIMLTSVFGLLIIVCGILTEKIPGGRPANRAR